MDIKDEQQLLVSLARLETKLDALGQRLERLERDTHEERARTEVKITSIEAKINKAAGILLVFTTFAGVLINMVVKKIGG